MNRAKLALARTGQFVSDHRVAIAIVATAAVTTAVAAKLAAGPVDEFNKFLHEKDLFDEFYARHINV